MKFSYLENAIVRNICFHIEYSLSDDDLSD